jgi:hypothetical protein
MLLFDMLGLALTLSTLALLATGGYLLALRLLGAEASRDPLALAVASLLAMTAEAVGIVLVLGALGQLHLEFALAAQTLLVLVLARVGRRRAAAGLWEPLRQMGRAAWRRLREHPALALFTAHAVGSEALRGLLRPPLSWDSLMYHLLLTATWLQRHDLRPVFGPFPVSDYGFVTANGSLWLWWWMAPSHSELYVNLSALPQWALLGLASGAVARQLGARRHWPLASFLVLLTPTVAHFVATQYVDIFVGATFLTACFFVLRWLERPRLGEAALAGAAAGLAAGAKFLGVPYGMALAAATLVVALLPARRGAPGDDDGTDPAGSAGSATTTARPTATAAPVLRPSPTAAGWRRRLTHAFVAVLMAAALGSYFYLRNVALGAGPLALACEGREAGDDAKPGPILGTMTPAAPATPTAAPSSPAGPAGMPGGGGAVLPRLPRRDSVLDLWPRFDHHQVLDAFLGITRPQSHELGVGPQALLLLLVSLVLPFGIGAARRSAALLAASQIGFQLLFWVTVPFSANLNIFTNVRYLIPALGLALAGGVALAEHRRMPDAWVQGIAIALGCQGLLQFHAEMPHGVRIAVAVADLLAVALGLSGELRTAVRRHAAPLAAAVVVAALLAAPVLARFRLADRDRALENEWVAHSTSSHLFAGGWRWLDENGGSGAVDVVGAPATYFVYPAMGPYLERRAVYVNVNRANFDLASRYPACDPRADRSLDAWLDNLAGANVRWLLLTRYPQFDYAIEHTWADAHPDRFILRHQDATTLVYEVLPPPPMVPRRAS